MKTEVKEYKIPGEYSETIKAIKDVIAHGNLSGLNEEARLKYYAAVCDTAGLNPLTRPFDFIEMGKGKEKKIVLYAKKECTEQLRKIHGISCEKVEHRKEDGLYIVTVYLKDKTGRTDISTAAICMLEPDLIAEWDDQNRKYKYKPNPKAGQTLGGNDLANLVMKTETKAKRRGTLSISGLGILDELEIETIPNEKFINSQEESTKPEDYKLLSTEEVKDYAREDQINIIKELIIQLQKPEDYFKKVLKVKLGHEDETKVPKDIADKWQEHLKVSLEKTQQFIKEMDGEQQ